MSSEPIAPAAPNMLDALVAEATRQLSVCNACRYCEGYCAVYPALERRSLLDLPDISQLANLCHDCRACLDACMYAPPHDFGVNVPRVLAAVRLEDYRRYTWPANPPRILRGRLGLVSAAFISAVLVLLLAVINVGFRGLVASHHGSASPYDLIPYPELLVLLVLPCLYAVTVLVLAIRQFWRAGPAVPDGGGMRMLRAVRGATWEALTLRYLRGGGAECNYPEEDEPSPQRRRLHAAVAYGFGLCIVSTAAAAFMQDVLGRKPPYPVLSVPVIAGLVGGAGLLIGCAGLLRLKAQSAQLPTTAAMTIKDYALLSALAFLALSGLATFLARSTPAFGIIFLIHLSAVVLTFAAAPYSKFTHLFYRFAALLRDNLERLEIAERGP
jgi:citrate/tricarballylate utilization protein